MKLIVAVDKNWGIGKDNKLLFHIPEDLKFFKEKTLNNYIVMGSKTLMSLPNSNPLPKRTNLVLSKKLKSNEKYKVFKSIDNLMTFLECQNILDKTYIIGGASIYNSLINYCDELYVTKIFVDGNADTFIENIDLNTNFKVIDKSEIKNHNGLSYQFFKYISN